MATDGGGSSSAGQGGVSGSSFLPWHLIPSFKPGETDINEYTRRLEFLANIWLPDHLSQLAPRACMLCEGTAFSIVVRLDPEKLRVSSVEGVKLVVSTLGGVWGQSRLEKPDDLVRIVIEANVWPFTPSQHRTDQLRSVNR